MSPVSSDIFNLTARQECYKTWVLYKNEFPSQCKKGLSKDACSKQVIKAPPLFMCIVHAVHVKKEQGCAVKATVLPFSVT